MGRWRIDIDRLAHAVAVGALGSVVMLLSLGCSSRAGRDCLPAGTYVDLNPTIGTASARICFGNDCQTAAAGAGKGNPTTGFYRPNDFEGPRPQSTSSCSTSQATWSVRSPRTAI